MSLPDDGLILLIDDNDGDFEMAMRAFQKSGLRNKISRCVDGEDALDYLFRKGKYQNPKDSPRPNIILLDLNMPGTDGREVLEEIKKDSDLKKIPVVILTTSDDQKDVDGCYNAGANSYMKKPINLNNFVGAIERLKDFWFEINIFPDVESR